MYKRQVILPSKIMKEYYHIIRQNTLEIVEKEKELLSVVLLAGVLRLELRLAVLETVVLTIDTIPL